MSHKRPEETWRHLAEDRGFYMTQENEYLYLSDADLGKLGIGDLAIAGLAYSRVCEKS